ncbi:MAG: hypothetical protein M3680_06465 [Myxococcota bacterium]|nr:hypothetical protein [Myxococcota bacterium]
MSPWARYLVLLAAPVAAPVAAVVCGSGCNQLLGLSPTELDVTDVDGAPRDGLLFTPDGSAQCGPRPAFESWRFALATLPFDVPEARVTDFTFYRSGAEIRAIAVHANAFHDVGPDGASQRIEALTPPSTATVSLPRMSPDGAVLWFTQSGSAPGVYRASRASGWTRQRADLEFPNAEAVEPGAVGFFAGVARMVVSVQTIEGSPTLHELSSMDGLAWTPLDTIRFPTSGLGDRHAILSPDGCYLLYTAAPGSPELRVAARDPDGTFTTSTKLVAPSMLTSSPTHPVLTPDADSLWFTYVVGGESELYRGTP